MAIMESKRNGYCNVCRGEIIQGQMIEWTKKDGAKHYKGNGMNPQCEPAKATKAEIKAYRDVLNAAIDAWDGTGPFNPPTFGEFNTAK